MSLLLKFIFSANSPSAALALLRVAIGVIVALRYGVSKFEMLLEGRAPSWLEALGISAHTSLIFCVFAQLFCSVALVFGLFTRLAAMVLCINFSVIVFVTYADAPFAKTKELCFVYFLCYLILFIAGAGRYSIDYYIKGSSRLSRYFKKA